jgi:hypothetical protein
MISARALATMFVAVACALPAPLRAGDEPLTGQQILARAKAVFRAHVRPPFVAYVLTRRDAHFGSPDFANSYALKIWCRTSDRSALTRRAWNGRADGALENITVAFDGLVDPGPPDADIFERALFAPRPSGAPATPEPTDSPLPVIGGVVVATDYDYRVTKLARDGGAWHLYLESLRDPARNRIDELWIDATTYEVTRMRVRDHLYLGGGHDGAIEEEFDVRFALRDGLPLIVAIHGRTRDAEFETDYTFGNVTFPPSLPDWYFEPAQYRLHRNEAPR